MKNLNEDGANPVSMEQLLKLASKFKHDGATLIYCTVSATGLCGFI